MEVPQVVYVLGGKWGSVLKSRASPIRQRRLAMVLGSINVRTRFWIGHIILPIWAMIEKFLINKWEKGWIVRKEITYRITSHGKSSMEGTSNFWEDHGWVVVKHLVDTPVRFRERSKARKHAFCQTSCIYWERQECSRLGCQRQARRVLESWSLLSQQQALLPTFS